MRLDLLYHSQKWLEAKYNHDYWLPSCQGLLIATITKIQRCLLFLLSVHWNV